MSIVKNSSIIITGVVISNFLAYAFHFIAGRMLGPADYGVFGALMALFMLVALPAGALSSAMAKFTSKYNSEKNLDKIALLRSKIQKNVLIFGAIMLLFIIMLSQNIADFLKIDSNVPVMFVGFTLVFALILPVNRGVLQGMKKFKVYSWNSIFESLARVVLLVVLLYLGFSVNGAILAYGLAYLIAFLLIFPYIKEVRDDGKGKIELNKIYKFIFLVLIVNLVVQSLINVPTLFVKNLFSAEFTGYWTSALNIARLSLFVTGAISLVMFPEIAGEKDKANRRKIFGKALALVLVASIGMALGFLVFPELLIRVLYGSAYLEAVPILQWMGVAMIFIGTLQLWANYWLAGRGS